MEKQVITHGKKISYEVVGQGNPVILVHGFAEDRSVWQNQVEILSSKYKIILPDLPGSGQSDLLDDMSIEAMADTLKDIFDTEILEAPDKLPRWTIIGHSMGGYITLAFAEKYPQLLNGFGLFHSSAFADSEEKKTTRRKGIDFIKQHGAYDFIKSLIPNLFSPVTRKQSPGLVAEQVSKSGYFTSEALISYYEAMIARPDRTEVLIKSQVPVLFIIGEDDVAVPPQDSLKQCHLPEKAYIHLLESCGHMGMMEAAELSNSYLLRYLSDFSSR